MWPARSSVLRRALAALRGPEHGVTGSPDGGGSPRSMKGKKTHSQPLSGQRRGKTVLRSLVENAKLHWDKSSRCRRYVACFLDY